MTGKLEYSFFDDKFFIEWTPSYEGSVCISSKNKQGQIKMHESTVPFFLYSIAKKIDDFSFLNENLRNDILNSNKNFLGFEYSTLENLVERNTEINKARWTGFFEGHKINETHLQRGRKSSHISYLMTELLKKDKDPAEFEYVSNISNSPSWKDKTPIHFLYSPDNEMYVAHYFQDEMNIVKLDEAEIINMISFIIKNSKIHVAGALKSLIKKKEDDVLI